MPIPTRSTRPVDVEGIDSTLPVNMQIIKSAALIELEKQVS